VLADPSDGSTGPSGTRPDNLMAETRSASDRSPGLGTDRLKAFSDGVFAIAVTLLVLELKVPAGSADLVQSFLDQWPAYLAYLISFSTIGAAWLAHSTITEYLDRTDAVVLRLNLLLLMVVSFIPFPTRVVAQYLHEREAERVAATVYGVNLLVTSLLVSALWHYSARAHLVRADADASEIRAFTHRLTPGLAGYVVLIGVGLFLPMVAVLGYLAIALFFIVPLRHIKHRT
jgi:uncharacterized membrane protein